MKTIVLSRGLFACVDDSDYPAVSEFKWHADRKRNCFYAARNVRGEDGKKTIQYLHRFLLPGHAQIDHRDGNGLNNTRENLRPATNSLNQRGHQRKWVRASSIYRGVSWDPDRNKWRSSLRMHGKQVYSKRFDSEIDAARAYDAAARKYFGEFASPNFL